RSNVGYAQAPHLFLNDGQGNFRDVVASIGGGFSVPKVARGLACGDFDRDGAVDLLVTTNGGPAYLYRNEITNGNHYLRLQPTGRKPTRDAIGAVVRVPTPDGTQPRMVKTGSSYLSQSELALTFGLARHNTVDRVVIEWPSGAIQEFKHVKSGVYVCT